MKCLLPNSSGDSISDQTDLWKFLSSHKLPLLTKRRGVTLDVSQTLPGSPWDKSDAGVEACSINANLRAVGRSLSHRIGIAQDSPVTSKRVK